MSSVLNNQGAMVALDTLQGINKNLGMVQSEISTGKSINTARDNAAIWSIATVMESDVDGFEQISNSLNLGSATVGVARQASEDIVSELKNIRDNVIAAQESNVDRTKIQTDINESVELIKGFVSGAQFNGQNLLNDSGSVSILSSLDRSSTGAKPKVMCTPSLLAGHRLIIPRLQQTRRILLRQISWLRSIQLLQLALQLKLELMLMRSTLMSPTQMTAR